MKEWIICLLFFLPGMSVAQSIVTGRVYWDKNQNGKYDKGEPVLRGIPVSNGDTIVMTNRNGEYSLTVFSGESVFPILPSEYTLTTTNEQIENSHYVYFPAGDVPAKNRVDFALSRIVVAPSFRVAAVGDMQVGKYSEENYAGATILSELAERRDIDFSIHLGDIVNEPFPYLKNMYGMMRVIPTPSWTVLGNHDRDLTHGPEKQESVFNTYFGAATYSFNRGGIHFIVINNIFPDGQRGYNGAYNDKQIRFLKNDLKLVPRQNRIVICQHIPMMYTAQKEQILGLLAGRGDVLVLSGHTHQIARHFMVGDHVRIHELGVGATCGSWWVGERDWMGIPAAIMQCGSPRGYFTLDFDRVGYDIKFKGVGLDSNRQMDIWVNGLDSIDGKIPGLDTLKTNTIIVNVYGGCDSTEVRIQLDNGTWNTMQHVSMIAPNVSRMLYWNKTAGYPTKYSRRAVLRRQKSPHIWKIEYPDVLTPGTHFVKIKAYDKHGLDVTGSLSFVKE